MAPQQDAGADAEAERPGFAGHYRLERRLGSGGMGVVHLARSTSGLKLAVKVVHTEYANDPEFRGRFRQEVAAARRVSGAFTASVVDADPEAERPWMATLYIPGPTLADEVKRNGPLDSSQLRRLMAGLAEALRDIHRVGVVHRDLKPSNVLLSEDGPKVIDFGISRPKDSELRTETGKLIGTPPFMAPEQFRRPREVGPAADIFALGSVLVHAATGRGPFDSDSPYVVAYQVVHDEPDLTGVPDELSDLVRRCLAKEPEERPTPDELMAGLRAVAASYDTRVFIPGQRTDEDPERSRPAESGTAEPAAREPEAAKVTAAEKPRRGRRRVVYGSAGAAGLVAVLTLTMFQVFGMGDATPTAGTVPGETSSGSLPWEAAGPAEGTPRCSHGEGTLVCVQGGKAFALRPSDGRLLWQRPVTATTGGEKPLMAGGLVQPYPGQDGWLEALDPTSGVSAWKQPAAAHRSVTATEDTLVLAGVDGTVTGVGGASGSAAWTKQLPGHGLADVASFPGDDLVYVTSPSTDGNSTTVTALDPADGDVRWEAKLDGELRPVGANAGKVFLVSAEGAYGDTAAVVVHDPDTGTFRRAPLSVRLEQALGSAHGNVVHLVGTGGSLVAVDMDRGDRLWTLETGLTRASVPVSDGRHVFLSAPDGRLLAVDAGSGRLVGQTSPRLGAGDRVVASLPAPVLAGDRVYASAPDGTVFAVDADDPASW
ncbi:protein kinase domain-containing protein [Streptomyces sp. enrichment culture]|uniref:serine/threonine-protein kinase n=1 Tax=Streptomyces sp. enrichment culture TaxID=1795815 RepID=UPI003F5579A9